MIQEENNKKMKVKKGWLAVQVGLEDGDDGDHGGATRRFVIPISYLYHPLFRHLLDRAYEVYGYHADGPLKLPCSVDDFLHLRWRIEKEPNHHHHHHGQGGHHHNQHHHLPQALFFHC